MALLKIVQLSAITLISIGLTLTGYGIYIVSLILFKNYDGYFKFDSDFGMFGQKYGALVIGLSLIIFGIFGILGSTAKKCVSEECITIWNPFVVLFYLLNFKAKEYFGRSCESTQNFKALSDGVKSANESFCSIKCPCNLDATKFNDKSVLRGKVGFSSSVLPSNVQSCVGFDTEEYKYPVQLMNVSTISMCLDFGNELFMFWMVYQYFHICFSDINRGNTSGQSCFLKFQSYYEDYVTIMGYISLCLGILFMLSFLSYFVFIVEDMIWKNRGLKSQDCYANDQKYIYYQDSLLQVQYLILKRIYLCQFINLNLIIIKIKLLLSIKNKFNDQYTQDNRYFDNRIHFYQS